MKDLWLIILLVFCGSFVFAQTPEESLSDSGNAFLRYCSGVNKEHNSQVELARLNGCRTYVKGFTHGVLSERIYAETVADKKILLPFCLPPDIEAVQALGVVVKYMRDNPEMTNKTTAVLIYHAFQEAYVCPSK